MNREVLRLRTFQDWPVNTPVSHEQIAKAGFYYTGRGTQVQCFLCGVQVSDWSHGDQAIAIHRTANPECPFVQDPNSTCNEPLNNSPDAENALDTSERQIGRSTQERNNSGNDSRYLLRLHTFANWPIPSVISPERLARSGFYYLQQQDVVECAFCKGVLLNWRPGDDPDQLHRMQFPNCTFYLHRDGNSLISDQSTEKTELDNVKLMPGATSDLGELGIQQHAAPKQVKYATYDARLNTFKGWPTHLRQNPDMLAGAGFYYVGVEDQVRCFHCDGGLRNWEETDDVWIEHAKWFPKCHYVSLVQGPEFVKQCIQSKLGSNAPTLIATASDYQEDSSNSTPSSSTSSSSSNSVVRALMDAAVESLLGTPPALAALEYGLDVNRVKMAIKRRMEQTGIPYTNADELIEDATHILLEENDNLNNIDTPGSPSTELTQLLNQIITSAENENASLQTEDTQKIGVYDDSQKTVSSQDDKDDCSDKKQESAMSSKTVSLEEENRRLKEARLCKICMDREVAIVFLPCGHLSTCIFCAPSLKHCPMCRQEIRATVRTFLV